MANRRYQLQKLVLLALMIGLDVFLSPLFRIEGMAPMSSVMNVIAAVLMGPFYATIMALVCGIMRMLFLGIPPLALTGAFFGALLAGLFYRMHANVWLAVLGEVIGTGLIGSLLSYPVMAWFTGTWSHLYLFIYTPRFFGGAISGSLIGFLVLLKLAKTSKFIHFQEMFRNKLTVHTTQV